MMSKILRNPLIAGTIAMPIRNNTPSRVKPSPSPKAIRQSAQNAEICTFPRRNANFGIAGRFSNTYFRIDKIHGSNGYDERGGRLCRVHVKAEFDKEVKNILTALGWKIVEPKGNWTAARAVKGRNNLYLHPMNINGVCENAERELIFVAFKSAETFTCRTVNVYEEVFEETVADFAGVTSIGNLAVG